MVPRPAIIVSRRPLGPEGLLIWTVMVTSARRPAWPGDVLIADAEALGLLIPSKVRTEKIAPAEAATAIRLGRLDRPTRDRVLHQIRGYFPT